MGVSHSLSKLENDANRAKIWSLFLSFPNTVGMGVLGMEILGNISASADKGRLCR
jgi:hypothetical protein